MTKAEIVNRVKELSGLNATQAQAAVTAFTDAVLEAMAKNEEVNLVGFGKFKTVHKDQKEVKNPATGGTVVVPEHDAPKFAVSDSVRTAFKKGEQSKFIK